MRECGEAARVVIHDAHFTAFSGLAYQDIQQGIPHFTGFDDEILHKNEVLRRFQCLAHGGKLLFTDRVIGRCGIAPDRHGAFVLDIPCTAGIARQRGSHLLACRRFGNGRKIRMAQALTMTGAIAIERGIAPKQIKQSAENREE